MNIDFHSHCNIGDPAKVREFVETYERLDTVACLIGGLNYGEEDMVPNEEVIRICEQYPGRLYPIAKIDLDTDTPDLGMLHYYAGKGVKGFKFINPWYEYDHDIYMPVYEEIEKIGLPVLFHTGHYRPNQSDTVKHRPVLKNMDPIHLDRIARSFQKLHIVMAHLGTTVWRVQAAELIKIHANLYSDLAGCGSWMALSAEQLSALLCDFIFVHDNNEQFFEKLIFGSDSYVSNTWPMTEGLLNYQMKLKKIGISEKVQKKIMGGTIASWTGIPV